METIGIILVAVALVGIGIFSWRWENAGEDDIVEEKAEENQKEQKHA